MPFLSEELYQRLPREGGPISICIAQYPVIETCPWKNDEIEEKKKMIDYFIKMNDKFANLFRDPETILMVNTKPSNEIISFHDLA